MSEHEPWDLIVVGAGPAGCAAAWSAKAERPRARILVLDRSDFPRDKTCGDGIAAEAFDVLDELGVDGDAVAVGYPPVTGLRLTSPRGITAERRMARPARVIPRLVFDARLVDHVRAAGVEVRRSFVRSCLFEKDLVSVDGERASAVVGADGSESLVRRMLHPRPQRAGCVALAFRGYVDEPRGQRETQVISMAGKNWPAYAWSFPDGRGRANIGYGELLTGPPPTRAVLLERMRVLLPDLGEIDGLRGHRLPLSTGRPRIPDGRVVLAGDAQSLINPLTGEGIFYALRSGQLAGRAALAGADAGRHYRNTMRRAFGGHFRHTSLLAFATRSPKTVDAGVRAARADQGAFDDLLSIGLGDGRLTPRLVSRLRG